MKLLAALAVTAIAQTPLDDKGRPVAKDPALSGAETAFVETFLRRPARRARDRRCRKRTR